MCAILGVMLGLLLLLSRFQRMQKSEGMISTLLPLPNTLKREYELYAIGKFYFLMWFLFIKLFQGYTIVWIGIFAIVIAMQLYERFDEVASI